MNKVVIVKEVPETYVNALSNSGESIDLELAKKQHQAYIAVLKELGYQVETLAKNDSFPDSVFIEDTAIVTKNLVIITNPKESSRNKEIVDVELSLKKLFPEKQVLKIESPGTLEGGDVLFIYKDVYVGISERTNPEGAEQLKRILEKEEFFVHFVKVSSCLHLKTGVTYLGNGIIVCLKEFFNEPAFDNYKKVPANDSKVTNCLLLDKAIVCSESAYETLAGIKMINKEIIPVELSEFEKADGGVTCLSLLVNGSEEGRIQKDETLEKES